MLSDEELLWRWRGGDTAAGNELFQRHFARVRRFVANKVDHDIEDTVQRTFMLCVENADRFEGRSSFVVYLLGIARNVVREHWRGRAVDRGEVDLEQFSIADLGAGPSTLLTRAREERLLLEALRRLPLDAQVVLETYFWERLTGPEISELFGVPEPAIRSRIRRAKERLVLELHRIEQAGAVLESTRSNLEQWAAQLRARLDELPTPE